MNRAENTTAGAQQGGAGTSEVASSGVPAPIYLPFPPSVNRIWRAVNGSNIKAKDYRQWIVEAGWELARQRPEKHEGPVAIDMAFTMPDKRRRDIDNLPKPVNDLLVDHQIIQRDDWLYVKDLRVRVANDDKPGVRVTITPLEAS